MNQIQCCDKWATRAGKMRLSCPLGIARFVPPFPCNKTFIDQGCSVKMATYWPRLLVVGVFMGPDSTSGL